MKKVVVLTGAGISAESGIKTFRDSGGLWEGHDVMEVASPQGWEKNRALVLDFYNQRRRQLLQCNPNQGHLALVDLEKKFDVQIITQNVDDLHERAGSKKVLHLHGELRKVRSCGNPEFIQAWDHDLTTADNCPNGFPLRPHIVWFGEEVPMLELAAAHCEEADIFILCGSSLLVYPAAGLIHYCRNNIPMYLVDPRPARLEQFPQMEYLSENAGTGLPKLVSNLLSRAV